MVNEPALLFKSDDSVRVPILSKVPSVSDNECDASAHRRPDNEEAGLNIK